MIKFEELFNGRMCNCCHKEDNLVEFDFRSDINNSGVCVALCRDCRTNLREILRSVENMPSADAVEVVRCAECKHASEQQKHTNGAVRLLKVSPQCPMYDYYDHLVIASGYCSMGMKKGGWR